MNIISQEKKKVLSIHNIKIHLKGLATSISALLVPIFQYIPCASLWFGIMSLPLFAYLSIFFSTPNIIKLDITFFLLYGFPWSIIVLFGALFTIYSFIYQIWHRKTLIRKGPYKIVRHPQYFGFIIITFGLTMISLRTSPIYPFGDVLIYHDFIVVIWIIEVIAYIILAKIEEYSLTERFGEKYKKYKNSVGFLLPSFALIRNKKNDN